MTSICTSLFFGYRDTQITVTTQWLCFFSGGVLPYKSLMGMCRWMGSRFHAWSDYNGVANSQILGVSRESKWEDSQLKRSESCLLN